MDIRLLKMPVTITANVTDVLGAKATATATVTQGTTGGIPGGPYPGQIGNLVGYQNTPATPPSTWVAGQWTAPAWPGAYPGSLTAGPGNITGGTAAAPTVIAFKTFSSQVTISNPYVIFVGCCFKGGPGSILVYGAVGGYHVGLFYCTFMPSAVSTIPGSSWPNSTAAHTWPSSGAGTGNYGGQISHAQGYDYGIATTVATTWKDWIIDHCDLWGFADAIDLASALNNPAVVGPVLVQDCWVHDGRADGGVDHTDGIGALYDSAPNNFTVNHCTVSGQGNTSAIAMQGSCTYQALVMTNNYLSGWNHLIQTTFQPWGTVVNGVCQNNLIGNDLPSGGIGYDESGTWTVATFNSKWRNNKIYCVPGYPSVSIGGIGSNSVNGYYCWPNTSIQATDWSK